MDTPSQVKTKFLKYNESVRIQAKAIHGFKELFMADLMAGIIVGIVALPLAIAFGIASGVSPEKGIITAIIAGFIISLLGGSKVQIGGPTGAFIVIIYGIIQQYGEAGLIDGGCHPHSSGSIQTGGSH